ncbi:hypothetical protein AUR64_16430 [Haloprofundus marisrubri]|uniref:Uncharacterized protein n=1 Tax=Haloprofundus marisrubri TaxID=1514971 RepID=A0A0W1R9L6_9EURY|nr:hypothetical protein [Haloprofundus marisrubri]KTG09365.1 hypothetical protein AUR64_16430 [Haloprofundus marisrubri]
MRRVDSEPSERTHQFCRRAIRLPIRSAEAELEFHRNMQRVAESVERKAEMVADPRMSVHDACDQQFERIKLSYETTLERFVGSDYESVAHAYLEGDRTDGRATLAAYLSEALWRLQQLYSVSDLTFFPVVLKYPNSCTINARFVRGQVVENTITYESPEHSTVCPDDSYAEIYRDESHWSQKQAASHLADSAQAIRERFPDPRETSADDRPAGGVVSVFGRRGSAFTSGLELVDVDPDRFDDAVSTPTLVSESPVATRTEREWLPPDATLL